MFDNHLFPVAKQRKSNESCNSCQSIYERRRSLSDQVKKWVEQIHEIKSKQVECSIRAEFEKIEAQVAENEFAIIERSFVDNLLEELKFVT